MKNNGDGKRGDCKPWSFRGQGKKETSDSGRQVRGEESLQNHKSATGCFFKNKNCDGYDERSMSPTRLPRPHNKDSNMVAQTKQEEHHGSSPNGECAAETNHEHHQATVFNKVQKSADDTRGHLLFLSAHLKTRVARNPNSLSS